MAFGKPINPDGIALVKFVPVKKKKLEIILNCIYGIDIDNQKL